jgi:hypothetical protein
MNISNSLGHLAVSLVQPCVDPARLRSFQSTLDSIISSTCDLLLFMFAKSHQNFERSHLSLFDEEDTNFVRCLNVLCGAN